MLWLRKARWFDGGFCFRLRNDVRVILSHHIQRSIAKEERADWIKATITATKDWRPHIVMYGLRRVGRLTFERREKGTGLPIALLPEFRKRGLAKRALKLAMARNPFAKKYWANIRHDNHASRALFHSIGYRETIDGWVYP